MTHKQSYIEIIIDERETSLYDKCSEILSKNNHSNVQITKRVLHLGDIAFHLHVSDASSSAEISDNPNPNPKEIILFERKSLTDLLASIKDGRYKEQSHRLVNASPLITHNIVYIIEGIYTTLKNPADKAKILSCITSLNFFKGFSILKTASLNETAEYLIAISQKIVRDLREGKPLPQINKPCRTIPDESGSEAMTTVVMSVASAAAEVSAVDYCSVVKQVKKENVTRENIGEIVLCQIPGISSVTAMAIMKHFENFSDFYGKLRENPSLLDGMCVLQGNGKERKISRTCIQNIKDYLL